MACDLENARVYDCPDQSCKLFEIYVWYAEYADRQAGVNMRREGK